LKSVSELNSKNATSVLKMRPDLFFSACLILSERRRGVNVFNRITSRLLNVSAPDEIDGRLPHQIPVNVQPEGIDHEHPESWGRSSHNNIQSIAKVMCSTTAKLDPGKGSQ
jgi:hypothetical protein